MLRLFQAVFHLFGFELVRRKKGYIYAPDFSFPEYLGKASYKRDNIRQSKLINIRDLHPFGPLAAGVIEPKKSLLYYDRLYTIYQALSNLKVRDVSTNLDMAEVGVYRGGTSYFILSVVSSLELGSAALHCFDTFEGHSSEDVRVEADSHQPVAAFNDTSFDAVAAYLGKFPNAKIYKGRFQDTSAGIADKTFAFVHIDVDLYEPTLFALKFFDGQLTEGGIFVVDDYGSMTCPGVQTAVDEFTARNKNYICLHLLIGQCVLIKCSPSPSRPC
jgi:hypothetical protein